MWYLITIINLFCAMYAVFMFLDLAINYIVAPKMSVYVFLSIAALVYLIVVQMYTLYFPAGEWKLKVGSLIWAGSKMYLAWALRFSSIKK